MRQGIGGKDNESGSLNLKCLWVTEVQMLCGKFEIWLLSSIKHVLWNKGLGVVAMLEVAMDFW